MYTRRGRGANDRSARDCIVAVGGAEGRKGNCEPFNDAGGGRRAR